MGKSKFLKPDQTFSQDLSQGALNFTTTFNNKPFHLDQITFKFDEAVSETVTITLNAAKGSAYDTVLQEVVLVSETDFVYRPQGQANFAAGDEITIACTQVGSSGTVSGVVKSSEPS